MKAKRKILIGFMLAALMSVGTASLAFAVEKEGISVNGKGTVEVEPDLAIIYANVETIAETAPEAQRHNNDFVESVKSAMINEGISSDKVLTEYSYVSPEHKYDEKTGQYIPSGFRAYTSLSFSTNDVENAGKYYDTALKAGATGCSISFSLENSSLYYSQALNEAVKSADASAKAIAAALGHELGTVTSVEELTSNYSVAEARKEGSVNSYADDAVSGGGSSVINYDKISVVARINVVYSF
ncbi:26 kDa periplasmic immunogenic protein [Clostridiales bacterium]|nr:26 kDa periplasmic immunogenic protein [Clostridiales bacterium]